MESTAISPMKSGADKLKERCKAKLGGKRFDEIYKLMRALKDKGYS
jgi:hypothetical protein